MNRKRRRDYERQVRIHDELIRRSAEKVIKATRQFWQPFEEQSIEEVATQFMPDLLIPIPLRAWKNNLYVVQLFQIGADKHQRLTIRRNDGQPIHKWHDFQRIKNEIVGESATAIEVYPPQADLVDEAHLYHLWILPKEFHLPFTL